MTTNDKDPIRTDTTAMILTAVSSFAALAAGLLPFVILS